MADYSLTAQGRSLDNVVGAGAATFYIPRTTHEAAVGFSRAETPPYGANHILFGVYALSGSLAWFMDGQQYSIDHPLGGYTGDDEIRIEFNGITVRVYVAGGLRGRKRTGRAGRRTALAAGFLAGCMGGAIGVNGPPIAAWVSRSRKAALLRSEGAVMFVENMVDSRYRHVPELVRMTVARPRKMLFSSSASTSFFSNSSGTVKPPSVSSPTDRALRTSP